MGKIGCGAKCVKIILIIFNLIFLITGLALIAFGVTVKVEPSILNRLEILQHGNDWVNIAIWVIIGVGAFAFLVGFLGCCGSIMESKPLLALYIFCLVLVMLAELAAGIAAAVFKDKLQSKLVHIMQDNIRDLYTEDDDSKISEAWDYLQIKLECCGAKGPEDFRGSLWEKEVMKRGKQNRVPESCCRTTNKNFENPSYKDLQKCKLEAIEHIDEKPITHPERDSPMSTFSTSGLYLNKEGCYAHLKGWVKDHIVLVVAVGCGIAALELIVIIFAVCLVRAISNERKVAKYERNYYS